MQKLWIAGLLAALAGGAAAGGQGTPTAKGYVVAQLSVRDPAAYADYAPKVPPIVASFGGRYLVRGGATEAIEGGAPAGRVVILEFPSAAAARQFVNSPAYRAVAPLRHRAATGPVFVVKGVSPG